VFSLVLQTNYRVYRTEDIIKSIIGIHIPKSIIVLKYMEKRDLSEKIKTVKIHENSRLGLTHVTMGIRKKSSTCNNKKCFVMNK
jgi:hypothetical protein